MISDKKNIPDKPKITKEMMLGELVQIYPETAMVLMSHGLHCVGCHVSAFESIEDGCKVHGMSDSEIDAMVKEMNELVQKA